MDISEGKESILESESLLEPHVSAESTSEKEESTSAGDVEPDSSGVLDPDCGALEANVNDSDSATATGAKKGKKKFRYGKKGYVPPKETVDRSAIRRVHHPSTKNKQGRKRSQMCSSISKFFLPHKRPRKVIFIPPTKFLLGGNISDPLNLNSLQDEDINRAMNAVTPQSSPLPTPPRHKAKIDVIIPPNIHDPLNLMGPLDNAEYEKRLEMQQRKPHKRTKVRRRTTEAPKSPPVEKQVESVVDPVEPVPESSGSKARKRSSSESENSAQKSKDAKKLRRMDSLDKIVSPVVPQPGAWMRARAPSRLQSQERPVSPNRTKQRNNSESEKQPKFDPKHTRYQYGNYDRYYGYRNLNAKMDIRLEVFDMYKHLFNNKDVLDIGCNVGHISIAVARSYSARSVLGMDIDNALIARAKKNLHSFIPVPTEPKTQEKSGDCANCDISKCDNCNPSDSKQLSADDKKTVTGRKIKKPKKNRKAVGGGQFFFPASFQTVFGDIGLPPVITSPPVFPYNVTFKQGNYVPREEVAVGAGAESPQFDLILCLSTTKWLHLNWGDAGLKRAFRKMFADLRPGGKLVLEAQNWSSYKKKKRLTPTIYENFNSIELYPEKFRDYLLSPEVGFSKCTTLGVPQHTSKGFRRPIQLFIKGDFTPSKACWSDAHVPSSHHKPEASLPIRTVYAPVAPAYRPSDDAPSCGAATPYSPNLDCCDNDSPFYNPRSDSYAPSYAPPRTTVYATLPSPRLGGASPRLGGASPRIGGASPRLGGASPRIGGASPRIGGASPMLGGASPMLGGASPMLGGASPRIGGASPMLGGPSPVPSPAASPAPAAPMAPEPLKARVYPVISPNED